MNRLNTQGRRVGRLYGILLMLSYLGCIVVDAQFAPADKAALKAAVGTCTWRGVCTGGCLGETADGSCPDFAAKDGNGVIGDWDVSKVTDFSNSTFAPHNLLETHNAKVGHDPTGVSLKQASTAAFNSPVSAGANGACASTTIQPQ